MIDEGYIKFDYRWNPDPLPLDFDTVGLLEYRDYLYQLGLIGFDSFNGVGYGNISHRYRRNQFIITGTQTGHLPCLSTVHLSHVISYNFEENSLIASGPAKPSAESLTHAAIYVSRPDVNAVIHVHSHFIWKEFYDKLPSTGADIPYGTPAMAHAVQEIVKNESANVLISKGHKDGIFAYGKNLSEAFRSIKELLPL